jgi:hypothetical protein
MRKSSRRVKRRQREEMNEQGSSKWERASRRELRRKKDSQKLRQFLESL